MEALEAAVAAIDLAQATPAPLTRFIGVAVDQQMRRPALAQLLEIEEVRLGASGDMDPVRHRVAEVLSAILTATGGQVGRDVVQDVMALIATLVNAAASRGERDTARLASRIDAVVRARLSAG